jgi:hypothetical protein
MVKEKIKPNIDFCDGCKYLHGDEDGENYYQFCELANGCSDPNTWININDLSSCPNPNRCPKCGELFFVHNDDGSCIEN